MSKSSAIKVSNAQIQLQQAIPTLSDRDSAELELHLFGHIDPVAAVNESPTITQDRLSPTRPVKPNKVREISSTKPPRWPSDTLKLGKKSNLQRKRIAHN